MKIYIFFIIIVNQCFSTELAKYVLEKNHIKTKFWNSKELNQKIKTICLDASRKDLFANKFTVIEDYDDFMNDTIYMYFIITTSQGVKIKLSSQYSNLDEGDSFYFHPADRLLLANEGQYKDAIIDFGIIEADGDDIVKLIKLVDEATRIGQVWGATSAMYAETIKYFFKAVASLKDDTRLVEDSIYVVFGTCEKQIEEFLFHYKGTKYYSDFNYIFNLRVYDVKKSEIKL